MRTVARFPAAWVCRREGVRGGNRRGRAGRRGLRSWVRRRADCHHDHLDVRRLGRRLRAGRGSRPPIHRKRSPGRRWEPGGISPAGRPDGGPVPGKKPDEIIDEAVGPPSTSTAASTWTEGGPGRCVLQSPRSVELRGASGGWPALEEVGVEPLHARRADAVGELRLRVVAGAELVPAPFAVCHLHSETGAAQDRKVKERKLERHASGVEDPGRRRRQGTCQHPR